MTSPVPSRIGRLHATTAAGEAVRAYEPPPLPPEPALDLARLIGSIERANQAIGRLDGTAQMGPLSPR